MRIALAIILIAISVPCWGQDKLDRFGDPIPAGADICLGTTRFRHIGSGLKVDFTSEDSTLVTANISDQGDRLRFCNVHSGKLLDELSTGTEKIKNFTFSPDRKTAAVLTSDYRKRTGFLVLRLADLVKRNWISRTEWQPPDEQQLYADWGMTFTPDGLTIIMTRSSGNIYVWDVPSREMILDYKMSLPEKTYLEEIPFITPDGETLINLCGHRGIASWSWTAGKEPVIAPFGQENVRRIAVSPDGKTIAMGVYDYDGEDNGPDVILWDVESQSQIRGFRFPGTEAVASQVVFSPDGRQLAASDLKSRTIPVWNTETGERLHSFDAVSDRTESLVFSPDGSLLATAGGYGGAIRVWNVETGERIAPELEGHDLYVAMSVSPSSRPDRLVSASDDGHVFLWDLSTSRVVRTMPHPAWIRGLAVSEDGRLIATSSLRRDDYQVRLWDAEFGEELFKLPGHGRGGGHRPLAFLKNDRQLASFGEDMNLKLWDTETGDNIAEYALRPGEIDFSKFRRKSGASEGDAAVGASSATSGDDSADGNDDLFVMCHGSLFSPDGSLFVFSVFYNKTAYVFDTATGKQLRKFDLPFKSYHRAVSPDNRRIAVCGEYFGPKDVNKQVVVCDLETGEPIWSHEFTDQFVGKNGPGPITFSRDGRLLAAAICHGRGGDNIQRQDRIEIWNTATHEHLLTIDGIQRICGQYALSISADNRYVACGQMDSTLLVWDLLEEGLPKSMIEIPEKRHEKERGAR